MGKLTKNMFKKLKKFRKNYNSNWNIFLVCIAIVMIWKWIRDLLDMYVFPDRPLISNLVCIGIGVGILLIDDGKLWELQEEDPHKERNTKNEKNKQFYLNK